MFMRPYISLKSLPERLNGLGLFVEDVSLSSLLKKVKTPFYVTSLSAIEARIKVYQDSLHKYFKNSKIFYACKAHFSQFILQEVLQAGAGLDIVSIGEWHAALKAGFLPENICFAGVGKKEDEWTTTILAGIGTINIEHLQELEDILNFILINRQKLKKIPLLSLRLNPCVEITTHPHLKTGALDSKFGILFTQFKDWLLLKKQGCSLDAFLSWLSPLQGIHVHIGSQLMAQDIFTHTIKGVLDCAQFMFEQGLLITHLDLGGGLGVGQDGVPPGGEDIKKHVDFLSMTLQEQALSYPNLLEKWGPDFSHLFVCLEPGRSVVASSTLFLTTVLYTKINASIGSSESYQFCYVDGAMNDFPRPSIYGAHHHAEVVHLNSICGQRNLELSSWRVVGPVCESGDFLSKNARLPVLFKNEVIAFFEAGAYCRSMASQYNLRPLPQEVFVKGTELYADTHFL